MVHSQPNKEKIVISRFHWKTATVWFNPYLTDGKPDIAFILGFHTPIVKCTNYNYYLMMKPENADPKGIAEFAANYYNFSKFMKDPDAMFDSTEIAYSDNVSDEDIPEEFRFSLDDVRSMVIIGNFDQYRLPNALQKLLQIRESQSPYG